MPCGRHENMHSMGRGSVDHSQEPGVRGLFTDSGSQGYITQRQQGFDRDAEPFTRYISSYPQPRGQNSNRIIVHELYCTTTSLLLVERCMFGMSE